MSVGMALIVARRLVLMRDHLAASKLSAEKRVGVGCGGGGGGGEGDGAGVMEAGVFLLALEISAMVWLVGGCSSLVALRFRCCLSTYNAAVVLLYFRRIQCCTEENIGMILYRCCDRLRGFTSHFPRSQQIDSSPGAPPASNRRSDVSFVALPRFSRVPQDKNHLTIDHIRRSVVIRSTACCISASAYSSAPAGVALTFFSFASYTPSSHNSSHNSCHPRENDMHSQSLAEIHTRQPFACMCSHPHARRDASRSSLFSPLAAVSSRRIFVCSDKSKPVSHSSSRRCFSANVLVYLYSSACEALKYIKHGQQT